MMVFKQLSIIGLLTLFAVNHSFTQRAFDDNFVTQGATYYNPAYSPTHRMNAPMSNALDFRTIVDIAPDNTGKKAMLRTNLQSFTKINRFTILAGFVQQPYSYTSNNELQVGLAYTIPFKEHHKLSFGLRGDFAIYNLKKLKKEGFTNLKNLVILPEIDLGVHYFYKRFEIGVSGKHLIGAQYRPDDILLQNHRDLYVHTSYNFGLGKNFELKPSIFMTPINYTNTFIALDFGIYHKVYVQYGFRLNELRHQYNVEYRDQINGQDVFVGLAFNHSMIYTNYNIGLRFGFMMGGE